MFMTPVLAKCLPQRMTETQFYLFVTSKSVWATVLPAFVCQTFATSKFDCLVGQASHQQQQWMSDQGYTGNIKVSQSGILWIPLQLFHVCACFLFLSLGTFTILNEYTFTGKLKEPVTSEKFFFSRCRFRLQQGGPDMNESLTRFFFLSLKKD